MLQLPFKGYFRITQGFGLNLNTFYKAEGLLGHQGIDFGCPTGTPILAPCDGLVIATSTDIQKGLGVTVMSDENFTYNGKPCRLSCVHWHLSTVEVKVGDVVKQGQQLGLSGNTGQTTGPHLHFSVAPLSADGSRKLLAPLDNGYKACIDPAPYLPNKFKELQELLNRWGASLVVDGKFGPKSKTALNNFFL